MNKRRWLWPAALAATIFVASTRSQVAGPPVANFDKIAHFSIYGLLATLVLRSMADAAGNRPRWAAWLTVFLVSLYGVTDEWHQNFTPGRSVELADWMADTLGATLAVLLYSHWKFYRNCLEIPLRLRRKPELEKPAAAETVSPP